MTTSRVNANADVPLLKLPGELFNKIFRFAVTSQRKVNVGREPKAPGLLYTCGKIYHEVSPIFWEENALYLTDSLMTPVAICSFGKVAGNSSAKITCVQSMTRMKIERYATNSRYLSITFKQAQEGRITIGRSMRGTPVTPKCYCKFSALAAIHESRGERGLFDCLEDHAGVLMAMENSRHGQPARTYPLCEDKEFSRMALHPSIQPGRSGH